MDHGWCCDKNTIDIIVRASVFHQELKMDMTFRILARNEARKHRWPTVTKNILKNRLRDYMPKCYAISNKNPYFVHNSLSNILLSSDYPFIGFKQIKVTQVAFNKRKKTVSFFVKQIIFIQTKSMGFIKISGIYSKGPLMTEAITWLILYQLLWQPLSAYTYKHQSLSMGSSI